MNSISTGFTPARILVCQLRQIGDVLLTTPALTLLKARYPGAELDVMTEAKCAPVLAGNPDVRRVHVVDKGRGGLWADLALAWRVAAHDYDLVVDFQQLPRIRWVVGLSRARVRLSFDPPWYNRLLYTHHAAPLDGYAAMSKASVLKPLGIEWRGERPRLHLTREELEWARGYLVGLGVGEGERLVTVDPSHRRDTRRWPAGSYGRLLALAARERPGVRYLILYGPGEEADAGSVAQASGLGAGCLVPSRVLSLREMAAVQALSALHLGNCSAPRHFAVAVDTPSLTIRGATSAAWTYPSMEHADLSAGLDCQPCNRNACPRGDVACLAGLKPETVLPAFLDHLDRFGSRTLGPAATRREEG